MSKKTKETFAKTWAKIVARSWVDEEFKKKLLKNPETTLKDLGVKVPKGIKLELHEQKRQQVHLVLPAKPQGVLSEQELKNVVAGALEEGAAYFNLAALNGGPVRFHSTT